LTPEQVEALEAMERAFGPTDCRLHNVRSDEHLRGPFGYVHWINRSAHEALTFWGQYKYALTLKETPTL
jgi:hypothetical protein